MGVGCSLQGYPPKMRNPCANFNHFPLIFPLFSPYFPLTFPLFSPYLPYSFVIVFLSLPNYNMIKFSCKFHFRNPLKKNFNRKFSFLLTISKEHFDLFKTGELKTIVDDFAKLNSVSKLMVATSNIKLMFSFFL